jgi:phosphoglycolate phosphatase
MIGDTIYDIKGAQAHNMRTIGVTYGYGKEKDLKDARANKIVHSVEELKALLV